MRVQQTLGANARIPLLSGQNIASQYPVLHEDYDMSEYLDLIAAGSGQPKLVRNSALQEGTRDVETVSSLRTAVGSGFTRLLEQDPYFQRLYAAPVTLRTHEVPCDGVGGSATLVDSLHRAQDVAIHPDGSIWFRSEGDAELVVRAGAWDPESAGELRLGVSQMGASTATTIDVGFLGDLHIPYPTYQIPVPSDNKVCVSANLLQLYPYALSTTVRDLRLFFTTPGLYRLTFAELVENDMDARQSTHSISPLGSPSSHVRALSTPMNPMGLHITMWTLSAWSAD
jgi:hypothetical protein